jgi:hypothetical protein
MKKDRSASGGPVFFMKCVKWGSAFRLYRNRRTGFAKPFGNLSKAVRISNIIRRII